MMPESRTIRDQRIERLNRLYRKRRWIAAGKISFHLTLSLLLWAMLIGLWFGVAAGLRHLALSLGR